MAADDYNIVSKHGKTTTASAVSPNSIKRPKERVPAKPDMPEVNTFIICQLCSGYLIDATGIIECQHTFCKSCILKYLETSSYCPVCDVQLNKAKPHLSLRSDVILQRLVYKLVPGLLVSEIRRRRDFSIKQGIDYQEAAELASNSIAEEIETATDLPTVLTLDDVVSLSIEYYRSGAGDKGSSADTASSTTKVADTNGKQPQQQQSTTTSTTTTANTTTGAASTTTTTQSSQNQQQQKSNVKSNTSVNFSGDGGSGITPANANTIIIDSNSGSDSSTEQANDRRYLQCPAAVSVGLLKKFIRMKYGLSDDYRVDLLYNGDRDSILENDLTLVDVAFIFNWKNKEEPMNIHYRIFERPVKSVTVYSGMKRPAPSVMDEPPDDDTASGPHNRSSMFSSSSAPSSKLARLADNTSASGNQGSVRNSNTSGKSTTTSTATPPASSLSSLSSSTASSTTTATSLSSSSKVASNPTSNKSSSTLSSSSSSCTKASSSTATSNVSTSSAMTASKVKAAAEKEEVEDDEDVDDDDEDEDEDYEQKERKEHMKGIKSSRRLHNSIKESMKRSVAIASSNHSLRTQHVSSSSRSHSTDTKGSNESERESARKENSLNSSSSSSKHNANISSKKRGKSHDSKEGKGKSSGKVDSLRLRVLSTSSSSSSSEHTSDGSDNHPHHHQPLKLSISTSGVTPAVVSSSACVEKKEPLKLSLGSVLANKTGSKSPERKHHKHKHHHHHHHHKLRHRDKQGKGVTTPSATVTNNSQKPLKLSFTLSPPSVSSQNTSGNNQSQKSKPSQESGNGMEVKEQQQQQQQKQQQQPPTTTSSSSLGKGKPLAGMQNYNNSARTSASAHGHLNNISKSISVSVNTNANSNSGISTTTTNTNTGPANNNSSNSNKGNQQYGNKMLSPAELIPKNTGIEIQPTTIPISSSQISQQQQQQHSAMQNVSSTTTGNNNSHKHSHPLLPDGTSRRLGLPDSVHVPKSVTLIPVNPNQMQGNNNNNIGGANTGSTMGKVNNTLNAGMISSGVSSQEKGSSGLQGNPSRINAHTFTHPITNKSLHQITVTEVPPPQQKSGSSNAVVVTTTSTTHSSISVSTSNPIEKVIANAANNKPQFNGPGSMEITKIYCGTASSSKENPAKKLKDRKGLDISITGTGINVSVNKPSQNKLEEALRQKVNIAIGGGSGSISVTPAAPPPSNNMSLLGQSIGGGSGNNNGNNNASKMKSVSAAAANLLSGKMPPGITIGPATVPPSSSGGGIHNNSSNVTSGGNNSNMNSASANAGNNIMKGLGFTLPPHLTAHPHIPNSIKIPHPNSVNNSQAKSDKIANMLAANTLNTNNSRLLGKDSISIIGKGNVTVTGGQQQQQQPHPVEITISATGGAGSKTQASITNNRGGISIVNKSKMSNDPLASIFDITQGLHQRKSPSPTVNSNNAANAKDNSNMKGMPTASSGSGGSIISQQQVNNSNNKNANMANKRPFELVSIGGPAAAVGSSGTQGNGNKKLVKESPEVKRSRSASTSSEPDRNKQQPQQQQQQQSGGKSSSSTGEIPLDLSGRSTRASPPITIPHPHPRETSKSPSEKPRKSPESVEKPGIVIIPSASQTIPASSNITMHATTPSNNLLAPKINVTSQKNITIPAVTAEPFKGQSKSISVSKLSPNQTSKIGSIVDSLAQKQAQAQQQQQQQLQQHLQNLKNSQNQQQQQHQHHHQQQQQHLQQTLKNSQQSQQHHHAHPQQQQQKQQQQSHQHTHSHHGPSSANTSSKVTSPNNSNTTTHSSGSGHKSGTTGMKSSPGSSSNNNSTKSSPSSSGLTSPITAASPAIPMTSPSPPNNGGAGDHLRNLWTLSDPANRQGKLNQMNELLVAASLFSPPGHAHSLAGAAAAHQLAAAAAAAVAASGSPSSAPSPGGAGSAAGTNNAFNSNLFAAQFGHHLAALGAANKLPPGMFDPHLMAAALNAHNAHAAHAAAGMRMHHPFVGSMSPPLNMPNTFFPPHGTPASAAAAAASQQQQQQPSLTAAATAAGLKIPSVSSKQAASPSGSSAGPPGKSPNSMAFSPLFSHSVPVSSPKSPNLAPKSSSPVSVKSPTTGAVLPYTPPLSMSAGGSNTSNHSIINAATLHDQKHSSSSHSHSSVSGKTSHHHHHHHHHHNDSSSSSTHSSSSGTVAGNASSSSSSSKSTKINGTVSTAMPVFPPGIHNPLLPSRSSSSSNNSSNNSGNSFQSGSSPAAVAAATTALNKSFSALNKNLAASSSPSASLPTNKGAIPNSMKISNFLPSKPSDSISDANAEATITSGHNATSPRIMPALQAKPNFSLSQARSPTNNLIPSTVTIPKNPSYSFSSKQESGSSSAVAAPISPVKGVSGAAGATNNKPSSMTCASLLRPDSLYSKPSHHLLNSLSPTKGDHHHHQQQHQQQHHGLSSSSRLTSRAPSSDSVLLSPSGSAPTNKTTSPGASISNKSHNVSNKDGFSRSADMAAHHHLHQSSSSKSLSPTKEMITSKSIPTGPAAVLGLTGLGNRNFANSSSTAQQSITSALSRPIPTIPAFLNRSGAGNNNNPCTMSSNISLHNMPVSKDGLQQQQKCVSPGKSSSSSSSISPAKMSNNNELQRQHPHLPLTAFPLPGVSIPVQVKLQDEGDAALPAVTSSVPTATSLSVAASTHQGISLKSEVNKLLAAKEEKMEEKRKRSCSLDQPPVSSYETSTFLNSFSHSAEFENSSRKIKSDLTSLSGKESNNLREIPPPAKVQKIEMQAGITSSVKNENFVIAAAPVTATTLISENKCSSESSSLFEKGMIVKSESELVAQRESKVGEGERIEKASNEKKGDAVVVAGADPSKEFSTPVNAPCTTAAAAATTTTATNSNTALLATAVASTKSPCKIEAETPSPVKTVEVSVEKVSPSAAVVVPITAEQPAAYSQSERQTKEERSENGDNDAKCSSSSSSSNGSVVITQEEKSTTQIAVDMDMPLKSDETSIQIRVDRQESKSSFEIPKGTESGQLTNNTSVDGSSMTVQNNKDEEDEEVDVDVEMEKESEVMGQSETKLESQVAVDIMDTTPVVEDANEKGDNQMEIDVEVNDEEKMEEPVTGEVIQNTLVEERVTLTKAVDDEDIDIDVVDVGVDEPMEINTVGIRDSVEDENNDDDAADELCIDEDNNESGAIITTNNHHEDNEGDSMEKVQNDKVEVRNELIESQPENNKNNSSTPTTCLNEDDDDVNNADDGGDMNGSEERKDVEEEKESKEDPIEISAQVIKRQKLEETTNAAAAAEPQEEKEVSTAFQVELDVLSEETLAEEQERNEAQVESTFVAVNETSNFSQDDSECGDLIIDLGPNAGENELGDDDDDNNDDDDHEPGAEDEEKNNEKEAEELLTQEESNHSTVVQLEIKESDAVSAQVEFFSASSEEATVEAKLNEEEPALSIMMSSETIEAGDTGEENHVEEESPAATAEEQQQKDKVDIGNTASELMTMESGEETAQEQQEEQQVAHVDVVEVLNQDSIPNQITINPASIEVNGVIKTDMESEKREESEMEMPQENVSECPQVEPAEKQEEIVQDSHVVIAANSAENEKSQEEREAATAAEFVLSGNFVAPEEDNNKNTCEAVSKVAVEEPSTVCGVMVESNSQLDQASSVNDASAEDNKNFADNNEVSSAAVDDKKIEEEQLEQQEKKEEQELSDISMLPESFLNAENPVLKGDEMEKGTAIEQEAASVIGNEDDKTAPVHFPEQDNNVENSENISGTDDSSNIAQETDTCDMGTPMEVEEDTTTTAVVSEQVDQCEAMVVDDEPPAAVEENSLVVVAAAAEMQEKTETSALTLSEIDDNSMQMETDSVSPTEDGSTCVHSSSSPQINDQVDETETEEMPAKPATVESICTAAEDMIEPLKNVNSPKQVESSNVAVISATITTASAAVTTSDHVDDDNSVVTPTTSTSSVAIKLDIAANDNDDDDAGKNAAASLLPSSVNNTTSPATTNSSSSSSLIIPSSNNTSGSSSSSSSSCSSSSSSSSSPVDVPATTTTGLTGIGSKSLETFGKVAAGLLASATSTINNNNNNTSLAPTTCDAISIATTNANA